MPMALAPTGLTGLFHRDGEIQAARAAQAAGVPFCLSTMSICSIEDVRARGRRHAVVPALRHARSRLQRKHDRARAAARCPALVVTLDLPVQALRRRDPKNGLAVPPRLTCGERRRLPAAATLAGGRDAQPAAHLRKSRRVLPEERHRRRCPSGWAAISKHAHLEGHRLGARSLAGQADPQGHPRRRRRATGASPPASMPGGFEPRRPPARRRDVDHRRAAASRRCRRRALRGAHGRRHQQRPGRAQGAGAGRTRLPDRQEPFFTVSPRAARPACRWRSDILRSEFEISMALTGSRRAHRRWCWRTDRTALRSAGRGQQPVDFG